MTFKTLNLLVATAAAALLAAPASAQLFGDEIGTDLDYDRFNQGFAETGYYGALDRDGEDGLSENEFATGLYADYDRDNDVQITEEEFGFGTERYFGEGYAGGAFGDYDADASGTLDQEEFGGFYEADYAGYYTGLDTDQDSLLSEEEYSTGLYDTADLDDDQVITIEEEGFFEGWFDGNDVTAEVQEVGEVLGD